MMIMYYCTRCIWIYKIKPYQNPNPNLRHILEDPATDTGSARALTAAVVEGSHLSLRDG